MENEHENVQRTCEVCDGELPPRKPHERPGARKYCCMSCKNAAADARRGKGNIRKRQIEETNLALRELCQKDNVELHGIALKMARQPEVSEADIRKLKVVQFLLERGNGRPGPEKEDTERKLTPIKFIWD